MAGTGLIESAGNLGGQSSAAFEAEEASSGAHEDGGKARLMRIYVGESDRWQDKPLHEALGTRCAPTISPA